MPASWPGIYFSEKSNNNVLTYAVIKNAYQGIICIEPSLNNTPKLQMNECVVDNIYDAGIVAVGSSINAVNCLISNCGANISIMAGGSYHFTFCTISSYSNPYLERKQPVTYINNFDDAGNNYTLNAIFRNCIIWGEGGNIENEIVVEKKGNSTFDVVFDHSLYKAKSIADFVTLDQSIANQNPVFDSISTGKRYFDFHVGKNVSPAVDAGIATLVTTDLDGNLRDMKPDLGCYEKQ